MTLVGKIEHNTGNYNKMLSYMHWALMERKFDKGRRCPYWEVIWSWVPVDDFTVSHEVLFTTQWKVTAEGTEGSNVLRLAKNVLLHQLTYWCNGCAQSMFMCSLQFHCKWIQLLKHNIIMSRLYINWLC